jgi:hypothetical protein
MWRTTNPASFPGFSHINYIIKNRKKGNLKGGGGGGGGGGLSGRLFFLFFDFYKKNRNTVEVKWGFLM